MEQMAWNLSSLLLKLRAAISQKDACALASISWRLTELTVSEEECVLVMENDVEQPRVKLARPPKTFRNCLSLPQPLTQDRHRG